MKKRITLLTTVVLCIVSVAVGAVVGDVVNEIKAQIRPDFTVEIDGERKTFKNVDGDVVYPLLYEGTTYLPVRAIGEIMGKTVYWFESEKRIELKDAKTTVTDADVIVNEPQNTAGEPQTQNQPAAPVVTPPDASGFIGKDRAKEIALEKAGLSASEVIFDRVELDEDDGVWHYEVEFKKGYVEYDADIAATDGRILSWDADID